MSKIAGGRLYTLDGIRGLAAICVGLYHCSQVSIRLMPNGHSLVPGGYLAVDFFFALSGLVIGRAYEARLRADLGFVSFAKMRLVRLYPLYMVGAILGLISLRFGINLTGTDDYTSHGAVRALLPAVAMLPNPFTHYIYPANPPSWSLFFELLINLTFAAGLFRLRTAWLSAIALVGFVFFYLTAVHLEETNLGPVWEQFHGGLFRVTATFMVGIVLARVLKSAPRSTGWVALVPIVFFIGGLNLEPSHTTDGSIILLGIPLTLLLAARFELPARLAPLCETLGDISYPFYVVHFPLLSLWARGARHFALSPALVVVGFVVIAVAAAVALVEVDARARRALARLLSARPSAAPQVI